MPVALHTISISRRASSMLVVMPEVLIGSSFVPGVVTNVPPTVPPPCARASASPCCSRGIISWSFETAAVATRLFAPVSCIANFERASVIVTHFSRNTL